MEQREQQLDQTDRAQPPGFNLSPANPLTIANNARLLVGVEVVPNGQGDQGNQGDGPDAPQRAVAPGTGIVDRTSLVPMIDPERADLSKVKTDLVQAFNGVLLRFYSKFPDLEVNAVTVSAQGVRLDVRVR